MEYISTQMTNRSFRARAESLHAFVYRARLCVKWVYFQGRRITILKITPTHLSEEPLSTWHIFGQFSYLHATLLRPLRNLSSQRDVYEYYLSFILIYRNPIMLNLYCLNDLQDKRNRQCPNNCHEPKRRAWR